MGPVGEHAGWWGSQEAGRLAEAQRAGLGVELRLVRRPGGGKGN